LLETFKSRQQKDRIDLVELEGIQARSSTMDSPTKDMCQAGFRLHQDTLENCRALDLPGTWGDLNASFSKEQRRKTKKRCNVRQNPVRRFERLSITALTQYGKFRSVTSDASASQFAIVDVSQTQGGRA
jgi:hypothetical protein